MGQTLSEPSQEKHTSADTNQKYAYAVSAMQGWRISMEDAHATILDLEDDERNAFFAVYDGHGGASVAKYAGQHVHKRLRSDEAYASKDYRTAFKKAFLGTDDDLRSDPQFYHDPSGCTAVATLITPDYIFCANAGDSRSVMSIRGEAKPLSYDHKPQNKSETARITAAGGYVEFNRVNGNLALSRAIGDFEFKQNFSLPPEDQIVTANPEIIIHDISEEDEFVVLACDGIWDCMSSQDVINWVRHQISLKTPLSKICEDVMTRCLSPDSDVAGGIGCDNMTFMVVALLGQTTAEDGTTKRGRTEDEWYDWVKGRVENKVGYDTPTTYESLYPAHIRPSFGAGRGGLGGGSGAGADGPLGGSGFLSSGWLQRLNRPMYLQGTGISGILPGGGGILGGGEFDDSGDEFLDDDEGEEGIDLEEREEGGLRDLDDEMVNGAGARSRRDINGDGENRLHAPPSSDRASSLRAQLDALDRRDRDDAFGSSSGLGGLGLGGSASQFHRFINLLDGDGEEEGESNMDEDEEDGGGLAGRGFHRYPGSSLSTGAKIEEVGDEESGRPGQDYDDDDEDLRGYNPLRPRAPVVIGSASGGPSLGEAPPPPRQSQPGSTSPVQQLKSQPSGDAPSGAVKVEGLMDSSESPTKM